MPTTAFQTFGLAANRLDPVFDPPNARLLDVNLAASQTLARGTVLGELTATPGTYKAYASANVDGSQNPKLILQYACTVDASGNITSTGFWQPSEKATPAYRSGSFRLEDLTGLDANAVTKLSGLVIAGAVGGTGIFTFGQ